MSFVCQSCNRSQENGVKPIKVVIQTREKIYPVRYVGKIVIDNGGRGTEIVKEINMCELCFNKFDLYKNSLKRLSTYAEAKTLQGFITGVK